MLAVVRCDMHRRKLAHYDVFGVFFSEISGSPLAAPQTSSTVDFDGDCVADLVVVAMGPNDPGLKYLEFWSMENVIDIHGQPKSRVATLNGLGMLSWADIGVRGCLSWVVTNL